jgi:hypothetical protein
MKPLLWWKGICGDTTLSKIPIAALSMPVTSAATERVFSSHSNIHTKKRNRLDLNRSGKLTYIYHNLRLQTSVNKSSNKVSQDKTILADTADGDVPMM